ncbi:hypothetical protein GCM10010254_36580 [Streptomyces chromofuscus]|nr:hypothetical protein GCM10010254_36580 [Streptomyces chromofuscus]
MLLPTPGARAGDYRFDGEGRRSPTCTTPLPTCSTPSARTTTTRRAALTAALDHAQDALTGPRLRRYASSAAERQLHAQYAAALPLAEAATALARAGESLDGPASRRAPAEPRRLAAAVRGTTHPGPLPAPSRSMPALRALDDALLHAAQAFDRGGGG